MPRLTFTPMEEDMNTAHHFALGAMHVVRKWDFSESEHETRYALASGFGYFFVRDGHMGLGIDAAWDAYRRELEDWAVAVATAPTSH